MRIIAGLYKNQKIVSPKGLVTRPTAEKLRQALFNICQAYIEDAEFLDLFAGSGAMGLEALSRGARLATFVDANRDSIRSIKENLQALDIKEKGIVVGGDVFAQLEKLSKQGRQYDIIYADPPYDAITYFQGEQMSFSERVVRMVDSSQLLKESGRLFVEDSSDSQPAVKNLQNLELADTRRMGRSALQQYRHI